MPVPALANDGVLVAPRLERRHPSRGSRVIDKLVLERGCRVNRNRQQQYEDQHDVYSAGHFTHLLAHSGNDRQGNPANERSRGAPGLRRHGDQA